MASSLLSALVCCAPVSTDYEGTRLVRPRCHPPVPQGWPGLSSTEGCGYSVPVWSLT